MYDMVGNMDEAATQPLTQQHVDPRRAGTKSMLSVQDEADVLCVLLPLSPSAIETVDFVAETAPQHLLQNHLITGIPEARYAVKQEATEPASPGDLGSDTSQLMATIEDGTTQETAFSGRDIALRMSSKILDPTKGFIFGRGVGACDIAFKTDRTYISSKHFRIYLNRHGVLMLEDTSTNGTYVNQTLVVEPRENRNPEKFPPSANFPPRQMLDNGAVIELPLGSAKKEGLLRFIVRIPSRHNASKQYEQRIAAYLQYIEQAERQAQVAKAANGKLPAIPPVIESFLLKSALADSVTQMPFNPLNHEPKEPSPSAPLLAAATGDYNYGAQWNGGEKYNVVGYIGKGAFAMVFKVSTRADGEVYAAKQIEKRRFIKDGQLGSKVHHEIAIMERLRHVGPPLRSNPSLHTNGASAKHRTIYGVSGDVVPHLHYHGIC